MRCTCQRAVIEALEEVLAWDEARDWPMEYEYAYEGLLDHIRAKIGTVRANAKGPEYKSYGWCPVCGHLGSMNDHKCGE